VGRRSIKEASSAQPEKHMPANSYTASPLPIGKFVQSYIGKIFEACDDNELTKLMDKQYSKTVFDINYPFCAELEAIPHVRYATTNPSPRLRELLEPYRMTPERWWERVTRGL
jgi:hypothetical protein